MPGAGAIHTICFGWWSQPVDATPVVNLSAGVSNSNVFRGRSFGWRATLLRCVGEYIDKPPPFRKVLSEQAFGVLIGTAPSAFLRPRLSFSGKLSTMYLTCKQKIQRFRLRQSVADLPDFLYQQDRETTAWVGSNPVGVLGG